MSKLLGAFALAVICSTGISAADRRVPVTLTGCVHPGTDADTFVLTDVEESAAGKSTPALATYWLATTTGLSQHVGHRVEVMGTFSPTRDAGKTAKVKIQSDRGTDQEKVAVENGMKRAETRNSTGVVGTSGVKTEITRPYRRLEVDSVKMIAASCF